MPMPVPGALWRATPFAAISPQIGVLGPGVLCLPRGRNTAAFTDTDRIFMQIPEWTKPALYGAAAGAVALAIIGFTWGGWVTGGSAQEMASTQSTADVAAALTPYCVELSRTDSNRVAVMADLAKASSYSRRGIVEKAGWATPLGADKPSRELAQSCALALEPS
tara:strand:+ start:3024 stop:3515 length:492 start_codon:yes stop_codon:yes gene_type:complete